MPGYPVVLDLRDRLAVVVGGGAVGRRKVAALLAAGARVRLISRDPVPADCWQQAVELHLRPFHPADLDGAALAFAATGIADVDQSVLAAAVERGVLINLAADPEAGDFTLPACFHQGELTIAVATSGKAPALAAVLRDRIATGIGPEWGVLLEIVAALRREKLTGRDETVYSSKVLVELLDGGLTDFLARRDEEAINYLLTCVCGRELTLAGLGLTLPDQ